jgi:type II secretion system protein H
MINVYKFNKGFSLVELIVVMVIAGILMSIVSLDFNRWSKKTQIEKQTRELFSDANAARTESLFRKKEHSIVFNAAGNGYSFKRYSSENESSLNGTEIYKKLFSNQMKSETGASIADNIILFDTRGFALNLKTIRVEPVGSGASFDCIVISGARTNIGNMSGGGKCVQQ